MTKAEKEKILAPIVAEIKEMCKHLGYIPERVGFIRLTRKYKVPTRIMAEAIVRSGCLAFDYKTIRKRICPRCGGFKLFRKDRICGSCRRKQRQQPIQKEIRKRQIGDKLVPKGTDETVANMSGNSQVMVKRVREEIDIKVLKDVNCHRCGVRRTNSRAPYCRDCWLVVRGIRLA